MWSFNYLLGRFRPQEWLANHRRDYGQRNRCVRPPNLTRTREPYELFGTTLLLGRALSQFPRRVQTEFLQPGSATKYRATSTSIKCTGSAVRKSRRPRLRVMASPSEDLALAPEEADMLLRWCRTDGRLALRAAMAATLPLIASTFTTAEGSHEADLPRSFNAEELTMSTDANSPGHSVPTCSSSVAPFHADFMQEPIPSQIELSIYLCTDAQIQLLNKHYRLVDASTDVLSFPQQQLRVLGDVVISIETAQRQATGRLRDELRILLLHGILHLLGYDHEIDEANHELFMQVEHAIMRTLKWRGSGLILDRSA
ncbi:hypothetical protein CCYA_CCYA01G0351 [Cyanidiococcus yangmingshanensis]|nr:hypothetical protein CCYA_CCYA01G0351 [Cyanidiococcus yangmingshanensis]